MSHNYGYHLQEVVADADHAVTNLTKQDPDSRNQQLTRWHTNDQTVHISELNSTHGDGL
ncbi:MAG: hypothetical protein LC749_21650 [Actinobacteria bacterium]|nr:hypothetical protein [Actinomycetota bacterium]